MKLSVLIPCYNERATIAAVLAAVRAGPVPDVQIIVVDDASTDGTRELLQGELRGLADRVLLHERNRGKGGGPAHGICRRPRVIWSSSRMPTGSMTQTSIRC